MSKRVRILLIEDHPIVRDGCQRILSQREDWDIREAKCAAEGHVLNEEQRPDVILLDLELPDATGLDMMADLLHANPLARIIIFSMFQSGAIVSKALACGARGYLTKSDDPESILDAVDGVLSGTVYLGPSAAQTLALAHVTQTNDPMRSLTERERQVVLLLGEGKSLSEIASDLAIGYKSAANIVSALKQKLHIANSSALIKFAVEHRIKA
jgi:two-component system invasion response regulator UvrY